MPASSKAQQRFMGIVRSIQKGNAKASNYSKEIQSVAKSMKKKDVKDFADTDRKGLPDKVKQEATDRDYKDEYKKFQSSTKSKKYRAELNQYNRKKGTYGNNDGKDASHKGGKIAGFEKESINRGRAEKSRLKKEGKLTEGLTPKAIKLWKELSSVMRGWKDERKKVLKLGSVSDLHWRFYMKPVDLKDEDKLIKKQLGKVLPKVIRISKKYGVPLKDIRSSRIGYGDPGAPIVGLVIPLHNAPGLTESVKESDLGMLERSGDYGWDWKNLTVKKGKTVKVTHKTSGKSLIIIDKPNVKKEYEKIGYFAESVNEARSTNREWNKFEKAFGDFFTTVLRLGKANTKLTGNKTDEKIMIKNFNRDVGKFYSLMQSWVRGQNESVNEMPNFDRGTSGLPKGFIDMYTKIVKKLSKGKGYLTLSKSDKKKVWWTLGKIYNESINEGSFKSTLYPKKGRNDKIRFQNDPSRLYKLKNISVGNKIKGDPTGTSYMFVASGNRKEYFTKQTWRQAMEKGWLSLESVNEEIMNWQGGYDDEFKFKKGQLVKDINPDCPHVGSEGEVTKVTKDEVTYIVRNNGRNYKVGDELTKTKDQLIPLSIDESKIKYYKTISKKEWSKTPKSYKSVIDGVKFKMFLDRQKGTILAPVKVESVNKECCDNCKEGKVCCDVHEAISKDEWAQYPKYARKLKPYMKKLLKVPVRVRVIKQANHNPWIEVRVARFGKDIIPNDFRKKALKVIGGSKARDMDNINYGNIRTNSISMKHDQWVKLLGNKVKSESVNEAKEYNPEKRRKLKRGEVEVMKGKGSRQKWFYFKNGSDVKQLIKLGRNSAFPTGITKNNSRLKFDKGWHIQEIDEGFGSAELMGQKDLAEFEKTRQKNAEVLGYKLTGKSDIKPIKEKSKVTK